MAHLQPDKIHADDFANSKVSTVSSNYIVKNCDKATVE